LDLKGALKTTEAEYHRRTIRGEPMPADTVFVREGGGTGKAAVVCENQQFSLGQRVMMLPPSSDVILPEFLLYQLILPVIYDEQVTPQIGGSASPHLNIGVLRKFSLWLPSLDVQRHIVTHIDELHASSNLVKWLQSESAAGLAALVPSILDRAFRGEL
jgi:type I restriction enzyme S subunit